MTASFTNFLVLLVGLTTRSAEGAPSCGDAFQNVGDVIFIMDVSDDVSNATFTGYRSFIGKAIDGKLAGVDNAKKYAAILFNDDNSAVLIDHVSGTSLLSPNDFADKIRRDLSSSRDATRAGVIGATESALQIVSANQNSTEPESGSTNQKKTTSVVIFYVTTGHFDNEVIGNVTLLLDEIETLVPEMLAVFGIGVGNFTASKLEELVRAGNSTCRVKSLQEWWSYLTGEDTSTTSTDVIYSTLIIAFCFVNLVLLLLFLLVCIYAHKLGPKPETPPPKPVIPANMSAFCISTSGDESALVREESVTDIDRVIPGFRMSDPELSSGSRVLSNEGQALSEPGKDQRRLLAKNSLMPPAGQDQEILNGSIQQTKPRSCAMPSVAAAESSGFPEQMVKPDAKRGDEPGADDAVMPETFDLRKVGVDDSKDKSRDLVVDDESPVGEGQADYDPSTANVYDNQLAIQLTRAIVHVATPTSTQETTRIDPGQESDDDDDDDDDRDYVNVPSRRRTNQRPSGGNDYVNMTEFIDAGGDQSTGSEYLNVAEERRSSYFDVFKADAKRQIEKMRRLSQRLGQFFLSADGPQAAVPLSKDVLQAGVPIPAPKLHQDNGEGNGKKPHYVNGHVVAAQVQ